MTRRSGRRACRPARRAACRRTRGRAPCRAAGRAGRRGSGGRCRRCRTPRPAGGPTRRRAVPARPSSTTSPSVVQTARCITGRCHLGRRRRRIGRTVRTSRVAAGCFAAVFLAGAFFAAVFFAGAFLAAAFFGAALCFAAAFFVGRLLGGRLPRGARFAGAFSRGGLLRRSLRGRLAASWPRLLRPAPVLRRRSRGVAVAADAGGGEQDVDLVEVQVDHVPQVGDQLATGDQPELELVEVAVHGDVEAHALGDRRHRDVRAHLGAVEVQRLARAGDVGDDHVDRRRHPVGQLEAGGQPDRRRGDDRRRVLLDVDERLGGHELELPLGRDPSPPGTRPGAPADRRGASAGRRRGRRPGSSTAPPRRRCGSTPAPSPAAAGRAGRRARSGRRAARRRRSPSRRR